MPDMLKRDNKEKQHGHWSHRRHATSTRGDLGRDMCHRLAVILNRREEKRRGGQK
jgi:hypothetical protein